MKEYMHKLALVMLLLVAASGSTFAQEASSRDTAITQTQGPGLCLGYNPETKSWGQAGVSPFSFGEPTECPANHAMVGVRRPLGNYRAAKFIPVMGDCCPLPTGVLRPEKSTHLGQCPENSVVTGARLSQDIEACISDDQGCLDRWQEIETELVCTQIDTTRYLLSSPRAGIRWGKGYNFSELAQHQILRRYLPPGLREGIGRYSRIGWRLEGCVGDPPGSLLTGRSGRRCHDFQFKSLLDTKSNLPVESFANCRRVSDPLDPLAQCLQ